MLAEINMLASISIIFVKIPTNPVDYMKYEINM